MTYKLQASIIRTILKILPVELDGFCLWLQRLPEPVGLDPSEHRGLANVVGFDDLAEVRLDALAA